MVEDVWVPSMIQIDTFKYNGTQIICFSILSIENDFNVRLAKAWTAIDRLSIIWKSNLSDKIKAQFFPSSDRVSSTIWSLTKRIEKKLDGNYTRMLRAILNKSWKQHPTKQRLYAHLRPIYTNIQIRRTRHIGHTWRSKNELINDVLLWTSLHGRASVGRPTKTYLQKLCMDTGCYLEDLLEAMDHED